MSESRVEIVSGLIYYPLALSKGHFPILFSSLEWEQKEITMFGKTSPLPRQTAWMGPGDYVYSRIRNTPQPWPAVLRQIQRETEKLLNTSFNSALLNLYTKPQHSIGWHRDNEKELIMGAPVATVCVGGTRQFSVRPIGRPKETRHLMVEDGDVLVMKDQFQQQYEHAILPTSEVVEPRISVTFRQWKG